MAHAMQPPQGDHPRWDWGGENITSSVCTKTPVIADGPRVPVGHSQPTWSPKWNARQDFLPGRMVPACCRCAGHAPPHVPHPKNTAETHHRHRDGGAWVPMTRIPRGCHLKITLEDNTVLRWHMPCSRHRATTPAGTGAGKTSLHPCARAH